jgi:hypothetical protein
MNKEFVPYAEALALKELGFDEPCFKKYIARCLWSNPTTHETYQKIHPNSSDSLAPLYQQVFRWFREKYVLDSYVKHLYKSTVKVGYFFCIDKTDGIEYHSMQGTLDSGYFDSYEEAELACLRKLIEIVKEKL